MAQAAAGAAFASTTTRHPTRSPHTAIPPHVWTAWDGPVQITNVPGAATLTGVSRRTIYN
jgi:hypothetical protein